MKQTTLILTFAQAARLLNNLPQGHKIKLTVADANRIFDLLRLPKKMMLSIATI